MGINLTDADIAAFLSDPRGTLRDLDRIESELSLSSFIKLGWSQIEPSAVYKHGWHIDAISAHLEAVSYGEITRLIINVPPGTMKSISTSVFFPAWEWGPRNMPGLRYIGTSYSERFAMRDNGRMRNLVSSEWYQERWGDRVTLTSFGEKKFSNTALGFREAIPFRSLTGGRADRLIIDDPHSTEKAESEADRITTTRIFLESVPTRLNDPERSAIVLIMQRLHEEDVTGVALSHDLGYEHLMLPMEYDPARHCATRWFIDPRKSDGELLFPARFPTSVIEGYKASLGDYGYAGQMQQSPIPRGGGIFRWDWWQLWGNEDDPDDPIFKSFPVMEYVVASLDSAYTEKEENDYSALTIWGMFREAVPGSTSTRTPRHWSDKEDVGPIENKRRRMAGNPKIMLMHAWQKRLPIRGPETERREGESHGRWKARTKANWGLVEWVIDTCDRFGVNRLLIENKASGISAAQEIRNLTSGYRWGVQLRDTGREDKTARAYSVQHLFSDGMVYAPDRDWAEMVKSQMANFPKVTHKDLTDSSTQALRYLRDIGLAAHGHEIEQDLREQMAYKSGVSKPLYPV